MLEQTIEAGDAAPIAVPAAAEITPGGRLEIGREWASRTTPAGDEAMVSTTPDIGAADSLGSGPGRLYLASKSPRRQELLERAGVPFELLAAAVDDGELRPGDGGPVAWVMSLAFLKARAAADELLARGGVLPGDPYGLVLGADTVCVKHGAVIGQPFDADDARRILRTLSNGEHEVLTGVALLCLVTGERELFCDRAVVRVGELTDELIEPYIASGAWAGKAGAYNLAERIDAGWPIHYEGDPTAIMGLPMRMLGERLAPRGFLFGDGI